MAKIYITCIEKECGREFYWSDREQEYYKQNNMFQPKRCYSCRQKRKEAKVVQEKRQSDAEWLNN